MTKRFSSLLKKALILCCAAGTLASCAIPGIGLREADADPFLDLAHNRNTSEAREDPAEPETEEAPEDPDTEEVPDSAEADELDSAAEDGKTGSESKKKQKKRKNSKKNKKKKNKK